MRWPFLEGSVNCLHSFSCFLARSLWGMGESSSPLSGRLLSHDSQVYPLVTAAVQNSWALQEGGGLLVGQQVNGEEGILSHPRHRGRLLGSLGMMFPYILFQMTTKNSPGSIVLPLLQHLASGPREPQWSSGSSHPQLSKRGSTAERNEPGQAVHSSPKCSAQWFRPRP